MAEAAGVDLLGRRNVEQFREGACVVAVGVSNAVPPVYARTWRLRALVALRAATRPTLAEPSASTMSAVSP